MESNGAVGTANRYGAGTGSPHKKGEGSKEINRLTDVQKYRLFMHLDNGRDRVAKLGSYAAVAKDASEHLKFPVTGSNVALTWKQLGLPRICPIPGTARTSRHRRTVRQLTDRLDALAARVRHLESQFGITPPVA